MLWMDAGSIDAAPTAPASIIQRFFTVVATIVVSCRKVRPPVPVHACSWEPEAKKASLVAVGRPLVHSAFHLT